MQQRYQEDLKEFLKLAETPRGEFYDKNYPLECWHLDFFHTHTKEELNNFIKELRLEEKELDDYTFNYYMNVIIKYMNSSLDSHTSLKYPKVTFLPYKLKWVCDVGLFIDYSIDNKIRKAKILSVNGVKVEELIETYEKSISYGSINHLYACLERDFRSLETLYSLPNFKRIDRQLQIVTDKEILAIDLEKEYNIEPPMTVPDFFIQDGTLVFRYQSCHSYYIPIIDDLIKNLDIGIKTKKVTKFVLDLRDNGGGNSGIIKPLIEYLKDKDLELVTIVNKGVFSSGRFAVIEMQRLRSKIVGEQIGTPINCFGNVLKPPALTNTKQQPIFSKTYWYLDTNKEKMVGIYEKQKLSQFDKEFFRPQLLKLDEEYKETIDDFYNDCDIFLGQAIKGRSKNR